MFTVYAIRSQTTAKIYIGQTENFEVRLKRHNEELKYNPKGYTAKNHGPWKLVYKETFKTRSEALLREKFLKSHVGRNFVRTKLSGV